jgi:hypothetical protein
VQFVEPLFYEVVDHAPSRCFSIGRYGMEWEITQFAKVCPAN